MSDDAAVDIVPCPACGASNRLAHDKLAQGLEPVCGQCGATLVAEAGPVHITDATFQHEVLESQVPVVVDFWAPWCGPCLMIAPSLEKIASEMGGRVKIAKIDVDENPRYAQQYGVQGIPTLLLVRNGKIADRLVGALPEPALRQRIKAFAG